MTEKQPPRTQRYHEAEDCFVPAGTPVYAIGDGVISFSGKARGYGELIIIDHPAMNVYSLYGHLSTSRWRKPSGDVKRGELIAYIGEAEEGPTTRPHLHFGMRHVWSRIGTAEVATDPMGTELTDIFFSLKPRGEWTRANSQAELVAAFEEELGPHAFPRLIMNDAFGGNRADAPREPP